MYAYNQRLLGRRASLLSVLPRSRADQLYGTALCNLTEGDGVPRENKQSLSERSRQLCLVNLSVFKCCAPHLTLTFVVQHSTVAYIGGPMADR